ncbi:hypothetical protein IFM89_030071 [Coptis chinensis]|uniref:Uncharacterized protein n=1 Tax=Coptis chinensis TaxID=261450 RepID=A0A835IV84_9MAGN|nr:hypothetical protein IFM89_030071 [Coptis chinensis]
MSLVSFQKANSVFQGRVLGGSCAINAGFYSRADDDFFKQPGFKLNLDLVNRSYDWIEKAVVLRPQLKNWQSAVHDGLLEANVTPYNGFNLHHVVGTKIGGSTFDGLGRRHSAADLLNHARPSNIMVALHASVERILFNTLSSDSARRIPEIDRAWPSRNTQLFITRSKTELKHSNVGFTSLSKFIDYAHDNTILQESVVEEEQQQLANQVSKENALKTLNHLLAFISSPSLNQVVVDASSFVLPKLVFVFRKHVQRVISDW